MVVWFGQVANGLCLNTTWCSLIQYKSMWQAQKKHESRIAAQQTNAQEKEDMDCDLI